MLAEMEAERPVEAQRLGMGIKLNFVFCFDFGSSKQWSGVPVTWACDTLEGPIDMVLLGFCIITDYLPWPT